MIEAALRQEVARLKRDNELLRKTINVLERQVRAGRPDDEHRRLRAKIAEWEGSTELIAGRYYHGNRSILPYLDDEDDA